MKRRKQIRLLVPIVTGILVPAIAFLIVTTSSFGKVGPAKEATPEHSNINSSDAQSPVATSEDVEILRRFAEMYEPKSTNQQVIPSPPVLKEKTLHALNALVADKERIHEKYIVLIFIRLYRFHLEHFNQSYDLAEDPENALTQEFRRLLGSPRHEVLLSQVAEDWVKRTPELLKYSPIKKEMVRIEKAHRRINTQPR